MKKYLLCLLVVGLSIVGFSNAITLNFEGLSEGYNPDEIVLDNDINLINSFAYSTCSSSLCSFKMYNLNDDYLVVSLENGELRCYDYGVSCDNTLSGWYGVTDYGDTPFGSVSISVGGGNEGGNTGGSNGSSSSIIPGGSDGLTPAINGLKGTLYEIIPYIVYIGIGVLLMILGFYAIRWLVNWIGGKINSYFSSKRD